VFSLLWHFVSVPLVAGDPIATTVVNFTRLRMDTPVEVKRQDKTERPQPPKVPDAPPTGGKNVIGPPTTFQKTSFEIVRPPRLAGTPMRPDGDVVPIVRVAPEYPPAALARGLEGWAQVRFTVSEIGTVKDAVVVAAEPKKTFDDAALKAIARWRYNPKVENGVAVERVGLQTVIRFELDQ
jgi:protein TonB